MPRFAHINPSYRTEVITMNTADADGIKTAAATPTAAVIYETTDLDGANMGSGGYLGKPYAPSVTTTVNASTYNTTDPIYVEGWSILADKVVLVPLLLTNANGGETISSTIMLSTDRPIRVHVPAQLLAGGTLAFGTTVATAIEPPCHAIAVNDITGGTAVVYREIGNDYDETPITGGVAAAFDERPWQVAELHSGTNVTTLVAKWGTRVG